MKEFEDKMCPRCRHRRMKGWNELTFEEKILAERLPKSADFARRERETHLFCPRCWHEQAERQAIENC